MDCSRQAPLSMGILQAGTLEWVAMPSSQGVFLTQRSNPCLLGRQILYHCAMWEALWLDYMWHNIGFCFVVQLLSLLLLLSMFCLFVFVNLILIPVAMCHNY